MMNTFKKYLSKFSGWPIHPQWFCSLGGLKINEMIRRHIQRGIVIDLGCAHKSYKDLIPSQANYIGLDYWETSEYLYKSVPDVYGDAHRLPFATKSIDIILLLDVLEHLRDTEEVFVEMHRALRDEGKIILQVPFAYPLHDFPRDFYRWTESGIREISGKYNFTVIELTYSGHPVESSALLSNLAASKAMVTWWQHRSPAVLLFPFLALYIVFNNITSWLIAKCCKPDNFMPLNYQVTLEKRKQNK
jgi:SAM-dependent methyltransferase